MIFYLRARAARLVVVLFIVSLLTFSIVNLLPGDPAAAVLGNEATPEQLEAFRAEHGLDEPVIQRYVSWVGNVLTGDFGQSLRTREDVFEALRERLPVSLELMLLTQIVAIAVAVPLALVAAYREGGRFDRWSSSVMFGMIAMPTFMLALILIYVFALKLGVLPATGFVPLRESIPENLRTMVLPVLTLATAEIAVYQRLLRSDLTATLKEDYITLARAKGVAPRNILIRHTLRASMFSLITLVGINIGRLLGGAVIVETLFALPGVGRLLVQGIAARDLLMVQGVVLFTAVVYVVVNLLVDVAYGVLDPRTRVQAGSV